MLRTMNLSSLQSAKHSSTDNLTFVPLSGIQVGPDDLGANVSRGAVRSAPDIDVHGEELSHADESTLYHHF